MPGLAVAFDVDGDFWDRETVVEYDGRELFVENSSRGEAHSARVTYRREADQPNAFRSVSWFLNELAWDYQLGISVSLCVHGNGEPRAGDRSSRSRNTRLSIGGYKQKVTSSRAHLALGCYREALDASSPFYRFLSYYRVLEVALPNGKVRGSWVAERIPNLVDSKESVALLSRANVRDVGDWLYREGRHALAHASGNGGGRVRDISNFEDWQDIVWAGEIVKELAREAVIEHLDVPRPSHG